MRFYKLCTRSLLERKWLLENVTFLNSCTINILLLKVLNKVVYKIWSCVCELNTFQQLVEVHHQRVNSLCNAWLPYIYNSTSHLNNMFCLTTLQTICHILSNRTGMKRYAVKLTCARSVYVLGAASFHKSWSAFYGCIVYHKPMKGQLKHLLFQHYKTLSSKCCDSRSCSEIIDLHPEETWQLCL